MQCRGAKSFVDDLGLSRGVVLSRAAALLRSIETKPFDSEICPLWTDTLSGIDGSFGGASSSGVSPPALGQGEGRWRSFFICQFLFFVKDYQGGCRRGDRVVPLTGLPRQSAASLGTLEVVRPLRTPSRGELRAYGGSIPPSGDSRDKA